MAIAVDTCLFKLESYLLDIYLILNLLRFKSSLSELELIFDLATQLGARVKKLLFLLLDKVVLVLGIFRVLVCHEHVLSHR